MAHHRVAPALRPRLVLVEDDPGRIRLFERWVEETEFVLVTARSGGQAIGMFTQSGRGQIRTHDPAIAGLMLDHDLSDSPITSTDRHLSTSDVIPLIQRAVSRTAPVLIHSHNASKPVWMQSALEASGFSVTRCRFSLLQEQPQRFREWLEEVRDCWDPDLC